VNDSYSTVLSRAGRARDRRPLTPLFSVGYSAVLDPLTLITKRILIALALAIHLVTVGSLLRQPLGVHQQAGVPRFLTWRLYHDSVRAWGPAADFFAVYHAGVNAKTGLSIYRQHELHGGVTPYYYEYRYLPVLAYTFGRLVVMLPPEAAYRAWIVTLEGLFWSVLLIVFRGLLHSRPGFVSWIALVVATPFFLELHMGQFTFAAAALLVLGTWMAGRGAAGRRPAWLAGSAAMVAASIVLKVFPTVTLVAWVRRRDYRVALAAIIGMVALLTVPGFVSNPTSYYDFRDANFIALPGPGNFGFMYAMFLTLEHLGIVWSRQSWATTITVTAVLLLGATALAVLGARRRSLYAEAAVLLLAQFVTSYQVWEHHVSAALLAGGLLMLSILGRDTDLTARDGSDADRVNNRYAWTLACLLVLLALPTPYAIVDPNPRFWSFTDRMMVQWSKALPTAGLYVLGLGWLLRRGVAWPRRHT